VWQFNIESVNYFSYKPLLVKIPNLNCVNGQRPGDATSQILILRSFLIQDIFGDSVLSKSLEVVLHLYGFSIVL